MAENDKKASVTGELSHSKQKRVDRQKKEEAKKRNSLLIKLVITLVVIIILGGIAWAIVSAVEKLSMNVAPSNEYSKELNDNGFIKGVTAKDYVSLCDYKNIEIPLADVEYTDEELEADIQSALHSHQVLKDSDVEVADGDKVNIDYVGSVDGVEFEGGTTNGEGADLTIGSGTFIDDFEQQLIGMKPGETINVEVTFPEDYATADLAGKDAEFVTTLNGVYVDPEFDDDFVCAYYSEKSDTAEGYKQYLKDSNLDDRVTEYVTKYISDNTTANKMPKAFLKNYKATTRFAEEESYEYMNQMYQQYYGQGYDDFYTYMGTTPEEYIEKLDVDCKDKVKDILAYQAILENEGITMTDDDLKAMIAERYGTDDENYYNSTVEEFGKGYLMLDVIADKAIAIAKDNATIK